MPSNVGSALNYGNDYRRYKVSQYYQTLNAIALSGPAPMTTYGPGGWAQIFSTSYTPTTIVNSTTPLSISSGTQAINQNLPGSSVFLSTSGNALFSQAGLGVNLQLLVQNNNSTTTDSPTQIQFYLTLTNPANCVWNPNNAVAALALTGVTSNYTNSKGDNYDSNFYNSQQAPVYATTYSGGPTDGVTGTPVGATYYLSSAASTPNNYTGSVTIIRQSSTQVASLIATNSTNSSVLPQLNTNNASVFLVRIPLTGVSISAGAALIFNLPLTAYYNVPDINIYS